MMPKNKLDVRDDQVFLMMGVSPSDNDAECAIVIAHDLVTAKDAFVLRFPDSVVMTWPSLKEIKMSVEMMEGARSGNSPEPDVVVINAVC
jgi:hypothetical protein